MVYEKLTKNSPSQHPMLGKLLVTPNHTKSKENTKLNSFLQDLPQNVRSKHRLGFVDYITEVESKIRRLYFRGSRFLG